MHADLEVHACFVRQPSTVEYRVVFKRFIKLVVESTCHTV